MFSVCKLLGPGLLCTCVSLIAAAGPLRVCADPNDLPYSNRQQQGFENKLAELVAKDLGTHVSYTWYPQREKFFRKTLGAGLCDVVMGVPAGFDKADTSRPYYRSSYVFVSRSDRGLDITSLDDRRLRQLRIGAHVLGDSGNSLPPVQALVSRGIVRNIAGYSIFGNLAEKNPASDLIEAVARKEVDIAVLWGPLAGYFSRQSAVPLTITPIAFDRMNPALPLAFDIAIGIRRGDEELQRRLNVELQRRRPEIQHLIHSYGIPQVSQSNLLPLDR